MDAYLPCKIGETLRFSAYGNDFIVGWQQHTVYWLAADPPGERRRWGTQAQICEDIAYVLENGALPPPSRNSGF